MLRIASITLITLALSSVAYAQGKVDACKHTDAAGEVTWTIMTGNACDPMDVDGKCDLDREGNLTNCQTNTGF